METRIVNQADLPSFELIETKHFEIGYYTQKSPLKNSPNEDSLGFITHNKQTILLLADGVGGSPNGEVASEHVTANIINMLKKNDTLATDLATLRQHILVSVEQTNKKLIHDYVGARTTFTACIINNDILQSIQIGDSALIVCGQKGLLKHKTMEHSPVGHALAAGLIKEKEALTHPERHLISNVVGDAQMHMVIGPQVELASNDTILLASDGLFDNFLTEEIIEIVRKESINDVLQKLTELFQPMRDESKIDSFNKIDDVSFIVCRQRR